jgi:hypothetical protein
MSSNTTTASTTTVTSVSNLAKFLANFDVETTTEILLDGKVRGLIFSEENNKLLTRYKVLKKLSLVGNKIKSLNNFPSIPTLETLLLDDNNISDGFDSLQGLSTLKTLSLAGNPIKSTYDLQPLFLVDTLQSLNLDSCPVQEEDYEDEIFKIIPQLVVLDNRDKDGESIDEDESEEEEEEGLDNNNGANIMGDDDEEEEEEIHDEGEEEGDEEDADDGLGFAGNFNDGDDNSNSKFGDSKLARQNSLASENGALDNEFDDDIGDADKDANEVLSDSGLTGDGGEYIDDDEEEDGLSMLVSGNVESDDDDDGDFIDDGEEDEDDDFIDEDDQEEDGDSNPRDSKKQRVE